MLCTQRRAQHLLIVILSLVVDDVEEAELVDTLGGGHDTEPVTKLLLLEELLCAISIVSNSSSMLSASSGKYSQILEVSSRELSVCDNLDLALTLLGDLDSVAEVSDAAVNLDLVLEELLESRDVKDLVGRWLRRVDDELLGHLGLLALCGFL